MKILIFEYVTGGGLAQEDLPDALITEALLMLKALLRDLAELDGIEPVLLLDVRLLGSIGVLDGRVSRVPVGRADAVYAVLEQAIADCDAVWPIAPEMNDSLFDLTRRLEQYGKPVLSSPSAVVELTANKLKTCRHLAACGIAAVPTESLADVVFEKTAKWVLKPIDGAGCTQTFLVDEANDSVRLLQDSTAPECYIMQPFIEGAAKSLSCLFRQGQGWLLSVNDQVVEIRHRQFKLLACKVNVSADSRRYQKLIDQVAVALPALWGYVGIDFIETAEGAVILEINPRLTTSYVGLYQALGINVAGLVLSLLTHSPVIESTLNRTIDVAITAGTKNASL
ncbi:MAG: ATP-dependent carboxylate-amine ligase [Gammaproteobacteria bacterium HGW-Gammaproteobacteria-3]|nr:MAG: ATP-dependent carboxylate-amine ligase [Gammaproteobacteria bacterium HGW-Gammaproteobacteria-3]